MEAAVRLTDLSRMHPNLLWDDIATATAAVLQVADSSQARIELTVSGIPEFEDEVIQRRIDFAGISADQITKVRRTFERARLIELAAIGIAGIGLSLAGGHEIQDV